MFGKPFFLILADNGGPEYARILEHKEEFIDLALELFTDGAKEPREKLRKELKWYRPK
jgi:hypothetical protein